MKSASLVAVVTALSALPQAAPAAGNVAAGRAAFSACASCHQVGPSARSSFGPQLNGILGRRVGADPGFKYSAAMQRADFVWSEQTLAAFIKRPDEVVPGNKMRFLGIGYDERKLADLLAYLRTFPPASSGSDGKTDLEGRATRR